MIALCKLIWCGLIGLFRSRASLEIEILVLRHQLNILRRKSPKRPTFGSIDRIVFAGLYGLAPDVLSALAIVRQKPLSVGTAQVFACICDGNRGLVAAARRCLWTLGS